MSIDKEKWTNASNAEKMESIETELKLAIHNACSKDDLILMLRFLYDSYEEKSIENAALTARLEKAVLPCEYCEDAELPKEGGAHDLRIIGNVLYYYDERYGWEGTIINICPYCGRKLEERKWED